MPRRGPESDVLPASNIVALSQRYSASNESHPIPDFSDDIHAALAAQTTLFRALQKLDEWRHIPDATQEHAHSIKADYCDRLIDLQLELLSLSRDFHR